MMERSRRMRSIRVPAVGLVLRVRPDDHRRTVRGVRRAERFERDFKGPRTRLQVRAFGDQQVAAVFLAVDGSQENPAAAEFSPGEIRAAGGRGAVREAIEMILQAQGKWEPAIAVYRK